VAQVIAEDRRRSPAWRRSTGRRRGGEAVRLARRGDRAPPRKR